MCFFKRLFAFLFGLVIIAILGGGVCIFYAFKIEPYRLKVEEYTLNDKCEEREKIKIIQFSDLHIKEDYHYEHLEKIVRTINEQVPDIVVFTGDLYDNYAVYHDDENIIKQLSNINARYGKIAIWGNRDYGGGAVRNYESLMEQSGFRLLKNENHYINIGDEKEILFTGLDDSMLGHPDMPDAVQPYGSVYEVLLTHEPDVAEAYSEYGYNLVLSGHSHGGQIKIPFLPKINEAALAATNLATVYSRGMYELKSRGNSKLYVNTGIGTTHISARFGVVPEIAVFQIYL